MKSKVNITNKVNSNFKYKRLFNKALKVALKLEDIDVVSEVELIIVSPEEIKELNKRYKGKDLATDILSFANDYKLLVQQLKYYMLGDIYMCPLKIQEQSKKYGHSIKREWVYMFAHGVAHLLGYNHLNKEEENVMDEFVGKIINIVGVPR